MAEQSIGARARRDSGRMRGRRLAGLLVAGAVLALGSPLATSAAGGSGAITGTVYDSSGIAAPGVVVYACAASCTRAPSGPDGRFTLNGLAAGSYRVSIRDYSGRLPGGYATATGLTTSSAEASVVPVAGDAVSLDIHAPAAHAIRGTVTGSSGTAASGIEVWACVISDGSICGVAKTGADGSYTVATLPGRIDVYFLDRSGLEAAAYYATGGPTLAEPKATPVVAAGADVTGIDIHLVAGHALAGTVLDASGQPLAGSEAYACLAGQSFACLSAPTNATGSYTIMGLPAGGYNVMFVDPAFAHADGFYGPAGFVADSGAAATVSVGATDASGIDVRLPFGQLVTGKVLDASGRPVSVTVEDCTTHWCVYLGMTSADGSFVVRLASGSHRIHVGDSTGGNLSGYYSTAGLANSLFATKVSVGSADIAGITIQLRRVAASVRSGTSHTGTFTSSVTVARNAYATVRFYLGKTFAGTRVQVLRATRGSGGVWSAYKTVATVVVASNGYAYYSLKVSGYLGLRASVSDSLVPGVSTLSPIVYARSR